MGALSGRRAAFLRARHAPSRHSRRLSSGLATCVVGRRVWFAQACPREDPHCVPLACRIRPNSCGKANPMHPERPGLLYWPTTSIRPVSREPTARHSRPEPIMSIPTDSLCFQSRLCACACMHRAQPRPPTGPTSIDLNCVRAGVRAQAARCARCSEARVSGVTSHEASAFRTARTSELEHHLRSRYLQPAYFIPPVAQPD